jgi:hypothetical protein
MQYNLMHRDAVIKTFDTSTMDPDEIIEMKRLGDGRYFRLERAAPDRLPPLPDSYNMLGQVADEAMRVGNGYSWARPRADQQPSL